LSKTEAAVTAFERAKAPEESASFLLLASKVTMDGGTWRLQKTWQLVEAMKAISFASITKIPSECRVVSWVVCRCCKFILDSYINI